MANRKPPEPIVRIEGDAAIIDTGLYSERFPLTGEGEAAPEPHDYPPTEQLRQIMDRANVAQSRYALEDGPTVDLPDGTFVMPVGSRALWAACELTHLIRRFLASDPCEHVAAFFLDGIRAGRLLERLDVLPNEEAVLREKRASLDRQAGGRASAKLTPEEREQARIERDRLIELGHTMHDACNQVGEQFGVSYKSIERL